MVLSILHRMTGVALSLGFVVFVAWFISMRRRVQKPMACLSPQWVRWSAPLLLIGWSFAFFFHLCNGARHLIWDTGRGMEIRGG